MSINYLVKLEMLIAHVMPLSSVTERNSQIYATSAVYFKFARFKSS